MISYFFKSSNSTTYVISVLQFNINFVALNSLFFLWLVDVVNIDHNWKQRWIVECGKWKMRRIKRKIWLIVVGCCGKIGRIHIQCSSCMQVYHDGGFVSMIRSLNMLLKCLRWLLSTCLQRCASLMENCFVR